MKSSYVYALILTVVVAGWLGSGLLEGRDTPHANGAPAPVATYSAKATTPVKELAVAPVAEPIAVRVRTLVAEMQAKDIVARGRTAELRMVDIRAEVPGRIIELPVLEGARVRKNDIVARLDKREREAQLAETRALVKQRELEHTASKQLFEKGFRPETKALETAALLEAARSLLTRMEVQIDNTVLRAPFDGIVEKRLAELGSYLKDGDPIVRIVDRDPILVIAQVAEREISAIRVGNTGRINVITGEAIEGRVRYVATMAEPATRTFRVELEVPNKDGQLRAGVTAEIRITVDWEQAHFVSPAMLTLNDKGQVGVKVVNEAGKVEFRTAHILSDGPGGAWLGGLPEKIQVITVGQEYVRHGDTVRAVPDIWAKL
ncbi:MAG: efflux RND transporter periplasmic adaptor subunit [Alphaproteobacteria bacterium]|nr:efflux RND transporter periplasmic adaptor subunit [Alphaproteobacteria bacterium]